MNCPHREGGCRSCRYREKHRDELNARTRERRQANLEAEREKDRAAYWRTRERRIEQMRAYRDRHEAQERARNLTFYNANRERMVAKSKRWNQANRQLRAAREADRRAMIAGAFVEPVHPLVVLELADGVCGICGEDVDVLDYQVDHVMPISLGGEHSYSNTQPAHPHCNMSKGARLHRLAA